jgi:hypothetical protein
MIALLIAATLALPLAADPNPTTGVANPAVTDTNIGQTICVPGWSATVRPPASYTDRLKREQLPPGTDPSLFEEDHVWAISDGGNPTDPRNLRPQAWEGPDGAKAKDHQVEDVVHRAICKRQMTLEQGHAVIAAWILSHHPYPVVQSTAPQ